MSNVATLDPVEQLRTRVRGAVVEPSGPPERRGRVLCAHTVRR